MSFLLLSEVRALLWLVSICYDILDDRVVPLVFFLAWRLFFLGGGFPPLDLKMF